MMTGNVQARAGVPDRLQQRIVHFHQGPIGLLVLQAEALGNLQANRAVLDGRFEIGHGLRCPARRIRLVPVDVGEYANRFAYFEPLMKSTRPLT